MTRESIDKQKGMVMIVLITLFPFLVVLTISFLTLTMTSFSVANKDQMLTHAQLAADAGVDMALYEINKNQSWTSSGPDPVILQNENGIKTTYETKLEPIAGDSDHKLVKSIGKSYKPASESNPASTVKLEVKLRAVRYGGDYGVVSGVGGLKLYNSSSILGGDVFVNGSIYMIYNSQIGNAEEPLNVSVAHQNCPNLFIDNTYPRLCTAGELLDFEPIIMLLSSRIYGTVKANGQKSTYGLVNPGLVSSEGVVPEALPAHNRSAQQINNPTMTSSEASCSSGTKSWPSNVKIGSSIDTVTISGTCNVTINGNVWIPGKLVLKNSAKLIISETLGTNRPNIMVDGQGGVTFTQSSEIKSNSQNTGAQVITYWSKAGCSPNCTDVTGRDLYDSREVTTISLSQYTRSPNTVFYARWSQVVLSGNSSVGALVGQTVRLENHAHVRFGTNIMTGDNKTSWVILDYKRTY